MRRTHTFITLCVCVSAAKDVLLLIPGSDADIKISTDQILSAEKKLVSFLVL